MRVFIETLGREIISDYCFKGWLGAKNAGHDVSLMSLSTVSSIGKMGDAREGLKDVLPIGSVEYMKWFMTYVHKIPVPPPMMILPKRNCWTCTTKKELTYPCFVKPLEDVKRFTGFVAKSEKDFDLYPELSEFDGPYWCSEPFKEPILSEWRLFIHKRKIVNISCYAGDPTFLPPQSTIWWIRDSAEISPNPIAYTWDIAVFKSGVDIVELNDMWAIGPYGCKEDEYFAMLKDRWNQIVGTKDR